MDSYQRSLQQISRRIITAFCLLVCLQLDAVAQSYSKKQIIEDIDFVVKTLKRHHPNLYAHRRPKEFNAIVRKIRSETSENENYNSVLIKVQKILAAVCDEHTRIKSSSFRSPKEMTAYKTWMSRHYFRENLIATKSRVFMDNPAITFNRQTLLSIDKTFPDKILSFLQSVKSADGCAKDGIIFSRFSGFPGTKMISSFLEIDENYNIKVQSESDESARFISQISRNLSELASLPKYPSAHEGSSKLLKKHGIPFIEANYVNPESTDNLGIVVNSNPDKSIYYIYSYSFIYGKKQMKRTNKLLRELIKNKPKHVILDLSDNHGGLIKVSSHLLSYFLNKSHKPVSHVRMKNARSKMPSSYTFTSKEMKKSYARKTRQFRRVKKRRGQYKLNFLKKSFGNPNYNGDLTVLISPRTHSAGTIVASVLKRKRKAKLVGYVNAGSTKTSCFAPNGYFKLPNTKIAAFIPNTCFDRPKNANQKGKSLKPDLEVDPLGGSSNYLNTRILEAALKEITVSN